MTLTSFLPTLRESLPAPLDRDRWPAGARPTVRDVFLRGVSLVGYADLCGTPCVMTGDAIIPLSGGVLSTKVAASAVVTSVTAVEFDGGIRAVQVDADLSGVEHVGSELRLLARVSHAHDAAWVIFDRHRARIAIDAPALPVDLVPGDLLALPCRGAISLSSLRPREDGRCS